MVLILLTPVVSASGTKERSRSSTIVWAASFKHPSIDLEG
jgi:hypothetical protein